MEFIFGDKIKVIGEFFKGSKGVVYNKKRYKESRCIYKNKYAIHGTKHTPDGVIHEFYEWICEDHLERG